MRDSSRALETEPSTEKLRGNDADRDEEYDNNDDDHDDDNDDADLARDSPKEPAAKDRVGHVQRKNSHRDLAHKTFTFSLFFFLVYAWSFPFKNPVPHIPQTNLN